MKKKPVMEISMSSKYITMNGKYNIYWGTARTHGNANKRSFKTRKEALRFKNQLIRKYKKKYKIEYMYLAD